MNSVEKSPFYLRFGLTLISIAILGLMLHYGKDILLPFLFSILLATLLLPVTRKLQSWGIGKILSISICVFASLIVIGTVIYFLSNQIGGFIDDFPVLEKRARQLVWEGQQWVYEHLRINYKAQKEYIDETTEQMNPPGLVGQTFVTLTGILSYLVFLPIYCFLILYHKDMIKKFLLDIFRDGDETRVREFLQQSQLVSQQYISGLVIEFGIVFAMNTAGFFWIGIKYPVFLGFLAALLNIVPYIGMIIANIICAVVTLTSSANPIYAVWGALVLIGVQLVDNNILMPLIVGNRVKLNALAIILGVLTAGALGGVPAMFLAIPALAVLKLIFDKVPHLRPWAMLLGDEVTIEEEKKNPVKRVLTKVRSRAAARHGSGSEKKQGDQSRKQ
jgi:predicted PurR-regulated permease PerM